MKFQSYFFRFLYLTVFALVGAVTVHAATPINRQAADISGELKTWHRITLTVDGPTASENGTPNPFMDYRMQVTFRHPSTGLTYVVAGYFAADGNAAETSAGEGNKWRAHLAPDHAGIWSYTVSFRAGKGVAVSDDDDAGQPVEHVDGLRGTFDVEETDKTGRDLRGKGRLNYVGKHHLQFSGTKEFFLKAGVDAPENFLAYSDFDGEFHSDGHKDNLIKDWAPHIRDWQTGDPSWQDGKGKGIIGVVNYLASQGLNVFSFLTLNIEGDDRNVFPYLNYDERERIDCSRMDQWEIVFEHATRNGMYLHFKTQEAENVNLLDNGFLGPQRKLYYRELIARFSHHLAMNWNLGEEVGLGHEVSTDKKKSWAEYFRAHDPYQHHIVIHNGNNHYDLLGKESALTGFSLQTNQADFRNVHGATLNYLRRSVKAGKPWVVACDEPGDAQHSLVPDDEDPTRNDARRNALWGNIMAGGAGVEWYFGYEHPHSDLTCQDYRVREKMWQQSRIAQQFFVDHQVPFWNMSNANGAISTKDGYCLSDPGKLYLVFLKRAAPTTLDLTDATGVFEVHWFNPRTGGDLQIGSTQVVRGGKQAQLGNPPMDADQDWLAIVRPGDPSRKYPPGVSVDAPSSVMLTRSGNTAEVDLKGIVTSVAASEKKVVSTWSKVSGPGEVTFSDLNSPQTKVELGGAGTYVLNLAANSDGQTADSTVSITVEPFQAKVTRRLSATDSAYLEGGRGFANEHLKVEGKRRISFIRFVVQGLPPKLLDARIELTGGADGGNGTLKVFSGSHSDWTSKTLTKENAPKPDRLLASQTVQVGKGDRIAVPVSDLLSGDGAYTLIVSLDQGGNDIWFNSTSTQLGPQLLITFEDDEGRFDDFGQSTASPTVDSQHSSAAVYQAMKDFRFVTDDGFVPGYKDQARDAMAINAAEYKGQYAAAETTFRGKSGTYDVVLTTLTETDGESTYRLLVAGKQLGRVRNPSSDQDYTAVLRRFKNVALTEGDTIRVEFNTDSNGKIPEGDGFAFSRGRWRSVKILKPGQPIDARMQVAKVSAKSEPAVEPFRYTYNAAEASKVHQQTNGIVVVEAEDFDAVDHQDHRQWYLTTAEASPGVTPDPDPNHADGAGGGAYLEILPDTRVTHGDPLVPGVSFSNKPGQCSVLYYPVVFTKPGRYYVWVRMCCTGSEDNGLHVGVDGTWPASGARLQFTGKHGQWQWDSRQRTEQVHTGVLGRIWIDIDDPGLHTIMFSMREDGFEFDRFMLTTEQSAMKSKNSEMGPPTSPLR